mgnify:FL=1
MQTLVDKKIDLAIFKHKVKMAHECPICKEKVKFGIEDQFLKSVTQFPFTHVVLHGDPVHAMIVFIDANMHVRGTESAKSLEISRDGNTFSQLMRKWSNPF